MRGRLRERGQRPERGKRRGAKLGGQMLTAEETEGQERPGDQIRVILVCPRSCADLEWMPDTPLSSWWAVEGRVHALGWDREFFIPEKSETVLGRLDIPAGSDGGSEA